ncbi:MAG: DUF58 domain-containing protein [Planctomycetes bacterium]|jgi:uncharacterized protein (DUF58 family)|nr:DUF58 domain-containing protein [Planctomycetota bacterium]MCL4729235.1 DUF58 domain-containing protein [Planctomycetota bacterium]
MAETYQKYLDPAVLNEIRHLEVTARNVVEGFISGLHKSPYKGFSVEFAQHREYVPGDDLRYLDWKAFAKSDKYYIKEYEEETNFRAVIVLDTSESMRYKSGENLSKLDYGRYMAASLAYLIQRQSDAAGLGLFDQKLYDFVPPATSHASLMRMLASMHERKPEKKTDIGEVLTDVAQRAGRRSLVILVSDLFDRLDNLRKGLEHVSARKHDVIVFNLMDHQEREFTFDRLTQFLGMEGYPDLLVDPRALRKAYLEEVATFTAEARRVCLRSRADFTPIDTQTPLGVVLQAYLAKRMGRRG